MNSRILTLLCSLCIVSQMDARINDRCELTQETAKTTITTMSITNDCMANATSGATAKSKEDKKKLSQRVDSLEHELLMLRLEFEWEKLRCHLKEDKDQISNMTDKILSVLPRFNKGVYDSNMKCYDVYKTQLSLSEELFNTMKKDMDLKMKENKFSEKERLSLESLCNDAERKLKEVKLYLYSYKGALDDYGKNH